MSSGTAAIHLALKAAGVGKGDTVICSDFTFSATVNPILYEDAIPVFVDCDRETWNMDPAKLEEALKRYPRSKVVLVVHLYGLAADMDPIVELCKKYDKILIEDAAESLGTLYKGKPTGTFGDYAIFSFNGNKIITTSGGGIGRGQLKVLDRRLAKKKEIFEFYKKELGELEGVSFMPVNDWNEPNFWLSCITLSGKVKVLDIMLALEEHNIETRPTWKPMHLQPLFEGYPCIGGEVSASLFETGVCLPSDTKMTEEDLHRICGIIKRLRV